MTPEERADKVYDLFRRGSDLLEHGDFAAAAIPLEQARALEPEKSSIREALGRVERGVGPRIHEEAGGGDRKQEARGGDRSADVGGRGGGRGGRRRLAARDGPLPFSRHPAN